MIGPLENSLCDKIQISPFGVIPKSKPGEWRLIIDLSSPEGFSVNDGIDKACCSLQYITLDMVVEKIRQYGPGALLGKLDIKSAYRIIPVHPSDRMLLGMKWKGQFFMDTVLPFGLRSAPKLFNAVADALQWVMQQRGITWVEHYLDDFMTVGRQSSQECYRNMQTALTVCEELGMPVAPEKVDGPTMCLDLLGIEIDTKSMEIRLPKRKLDKLAQLVKYWKSRKAGKKRSIQSLVGHLCHACKVVRPGRRFLRGMFTAISHAKRGNHYVRLNARFRADLEWWHTFLQEWNGVSMMLEEKPTIEVWSDASGSWGCAAFWDNQWFQLQWKDFLEFAEVCIAAKELLPIVTAAAIWGREWRNGRICFHCDNMAVVKTIKSGYCKEPYMAHMLRCLFFLEAKFNFSIVAQHVPGVNNQPADALSRDQLPLFLQLKPTANRTPTFVDNRVVKGLVSTQEWTTMSWSKWFRSI